MPMRWSVLVAGLLLLTAGCGGCIWSMFERPRWSYEFDIGGGRTLTVWSVRRETHLFSGQFLEVNPLMVYYRVDAHGTPLVPPTLITHDDGGDYQFRLVKADEGRLTCVYYVPRSPDDSIFALIYDATTGKSWHSTAVDEGGNIEEQVEKWRERYMRLKAENPELPIERLFARPGQAL